MAFVATASTAEPRTFSLGPVKVQIFTFTCASGDTSGTITATGLTRAMHAMVSGLGKGMSAVPTFSGNVVTLAFADPVATCAGTILVIGV